MVVPFLCGQSLDLGQTLPHRSPGPRDAIGNYMIISVVNSEEVEKSMQLVNEVCGDIEEEGAGIAFTLPVNKFFGLYKE